MPADLTMLQARLDNLLAMRDSGVLVSRHGEQQITFRSMDELMRAITALKSDIADLQGTPGRVFRYAFTSRKGL